LNNDSPTPPMGDNIDTLEDELEVILENVHTMGMSDQLIGIKQHYWLKQRAKFKQALNLYIEEKERLARLEILRGFRRRDFVLEAMYETAILDRIEELRITDEDIKKGWPEV